MSFVRGNAITFSATFTAADGSTTQPTNVSASIIYKDLSGVMQTASLTLTQTLLGSSTWSASWDSTVAGQGLAQWAIFGTGSLIAAAQGQFNIEANAANT
jgi:hypothetical protein